MTEEGTNLKNHLRNGDLEPVKRAFRTGDPSERRRIVLLLAAEIGRQNRELGRPPADVVQYLSRQGYGYHGMVQVWDGEPEALHEVLDTLIENDDQEFDPHTRMANLLENVAPDHSGTLQPEIEELREDEVLEERGLQRTKQMLVWTLDRLDAGVSKEVERDNVFEAGEGEPEFLLELKEAHERLLGQYIRDRTAALEEQHRTPEGGWKNGRESIREWLREVHDASWQELGVEFIRTDLELARYIRPASVGRLLRELRQAAGMSQREAVEKSGACSRQHLSEIERERVAFPSYLVVRNLVDAFREQLPDENPEQLLSPAAARFCSDMATQFWGRGTEVDVSGEPTDRNTADACVGVTAILIGCPRVFLEDLCLLNNHFRTTPSEAAEGSPTYRATLPVFLSGLLTPYGNEGFVPEEELRNVADRETKQELLRWHKSGYLFGRMLRVPEDAPPVPSTLQQQSTFDQTERIRELLEGMEEAGLVQFRAADGADSETVIIPSVLSSTLRTFAGLRSPFIGSRDQQSANG